MATKVIGLDGKIETIITLTGATYTGGILSLIDNSGGAILVTGFLTGVTDNNIYTTAGTYSNGSLSLITNSGDTITVGGFFTGTTDNNTFTTGGSYSNGLLSLTSNSGNTISVSGFSTATTVNTLPYSAITNTPVDVYITGGTYSNGTASFRNITGGTFSVTGFSTGTTNNQWLLSGNSGTNGTTNFIGTTDNQSLSIRTNGIERILIDTNGNVINTNSSINAAVVQSISGTQGFNIKSGSIFQSGLQSLNTGTNLFTFFSCNKIYDGVLGWQDGGLNRVGGLVKLMDNQFTFESVSTGTTFTERFKIISDGKVAINYGIPISQLDVRDTTSSTVRIGHTTGNQFTYTLGRNTSTGYFDLNFGAGNTTVGYNIIGGTLQITDNASTVAPASAALNIVSTTKGILIPRMTTAQRTAIAAPATGLQVYDTTTNTNWYYNGSIWTDTGLGNFNYINIPTTTGSTYGTITQSGSPVFHTYGSGNLYIGKSSGSFTTNSTNNTALGNSVLASNTTGNANVGIGMQALGNLLSGSSNIAIGIFAGRGSGSFDGNIAIGASSQINSTASYTTSVGHNALTNNTTGVQNNAFGYLALSSNQIGSYNSAFGTSCLPFALGTNNVGFGGNALYNLSSGNNNTAMGAQAGQYISGGVIALTTINNSVLIGQNTKATSAATNSIVIGYLAEGIGNNTVVLGNDSILTTALKGNVGIGTTAPTARLHITGSTTLSALMRLGVGVAPTTPNDGDVWLESNSTTGLKIRLSGITRTITIT